MTEASGPDGDLAAWRTARDEIRAEVLAKGFDAWLGAFTQAYDEPALDAASLRLSVLGLLPADDPRMTGTIEQIERRLMRNGPVSRHPGADDGLPGGLLSRPRRPASFRLGPSPVPVANGPRR